MHVTEVTEAKRAVDVGGDVIVAPGTEAAGTVGRPVDQAPSALEGSETSGAGTGSTHLDQSV